MSFTPRSRARVRDDFLGALQSRWAAIGKEIDTRSTSWMYRFADALGVVLESLEAYAADLLNQILPDRAAMAFLDRHGTVEGVDRRPATAAVLLVRITGTASATVTFGSATLRSTSGVSYRPVPTSATLNGSGYADVQFRAATLGTVSNLADTAVLTWSATPVNAQPTGTVRDTVTTAEDEESNASYATRIIQRRRERPASGNRADWRDWVEQCDGVDVAFVYPLLADAPGTLGAVAVVALGPAQVFSDTNSRILTSLRCTEIAEYIEGTKDVSGADVTDGTQLRPVTIPDDSYTISPAVESLVACTLTLTLSSNYPFAWSSGSPFTVNGWTNSTKILTLTADPSTLVDVGAVVAVRDTAARGKYRLARIAAVGPGNQVTLESTFSSTTVDTTASGRLRPLPPNGTELFTAVFGYFDALGPGNVPSPSARWPSEADGFASALYRNALAAPVIGVKGVQNAVVTLPASDTTPGAAELLNVSELIFL